MSAENNDKIKEKPSEKKKIVHQKMPPWMWVMMIVAAVFFIYVLIQQ